MLTYEELLSDDRWKAKRLEILRRDENKCVFCKNKNYIETTSDAKFITLNANVDFDYTNWQFEFRDTVDQQWNYANLNRACYHVLGIDIMHCTKIENRSFQVIAIRKGKLNATVEPKLKEYFEHVKQNGIETAHTPEVFGKWYEKQVCSNNYLKNWDEDDWGKLHWSFVQGLNVHHLCYRVGRYPWEYENTDLVTACPCCHEAIHINGQVPVYDENGKLFKYYTPCHRCHGVGCFPEYNHIDNGVCFRCNGARYEELIDAQ